MSLNQGIQKYRENIRQSTSKRDSQKSQNPADKSKKPADLKTDATTEDLAAVEAKNEEAALQKEIAEELEKESKDTAQLVKEDFSPVNSTRDQLILEYAPLIKYI